MKILIAEDDAVSSRILKAGLKKLGYDVIAARDGEEAWALFELEPVRIVVSDWLMPGMDGLELCRKIRSRPRTPYTYFILLTSQDATHDNFRTAMEKGIDDFLSKPLNTEHLWARLKVAERILNFTTQIGQLKSLLPICMYCKKIRNDDEYWQQVETYISEHTGTDFSHGICPDCYTTVIEPQIRKMTEDHGSS